jgi:hypothetical protein
MSAFPLLSRSLFQMFEFPLPFSHLALQRVQLLATHLRQRRRQFAPRAFQNGQRHGQVALQFGRRGLGRREQLPLRLQIQRGFGKNALARRPRAVLPSRVQLAGLARIAAAVHQRGGESLAVLPTRSRHRDQVLQRHLRRDASFAHVSLDGFGQHFGQRQPPRYPARAAVETLRQLLE